jgi:hypothetical protein
MPTGLKRYSAHDYLHFLTCSCYHREPRLASPKRCDLFLQILEEAAIATSSSWSDML